MAAALDVRELGNQLDRIDDAQQKHSKELTDVVDKQKDLMHRVEKIGSTDLKRVTQQLDAESGKIVKLQDARKNIEDRLKAAEDLAKANKESNEDEIKRLKQVVAKLEIQAQDMGLMGGGPAAESFGKRFVSHEAFKSWIDRVVKQNDTSRKTTGPIRLKGSMWVRKDSNLTGYGADAVGNIITPLYAPGMKELPKLQTVLRSLIPSISTGGATDSVISYRETGESRVITKLGGAITATDTVITLDSVAGLAAAGGFNQITVTDGTNTETKTVTVVNTATKQVTVSVAFSNSYAVANTTVTATAYIATPAGTLMPHSRSTFGKYTVPLAVLGEIALLQNANLRHIPGLQDLVERRGRNSLAIVEEVNFIRGPGDGDSGIRGVLNDPDIATLTAWSAMAADTNAIDYLVRGYYTLWRAHVQATAALVSVGHHEKISILKGTDGHYVYFVNSQPGVPDRVMTLRLAGSAELSDSEGVMGDLGMAATIYDGLETTAELGFMNDDFGLEQIRLKVKEEVGFGVELPSYMRKLNTDAAPPA